MNKIHVRRDDTVIIVSGDDKGKIGKVLEVSPKEGKIIVEGVNLVALGLCPSNLERCAERQGTFTPERPCSAHDLLEGVLHADSPFIRSGSARLEPWSCATM